MANVGDIYKLWLSWRDLPESGVSATITGATVETVYPTGKPSQAIVLTFKNATRRLVLSQSQANVLSRIGSEDFTAWPGLRVHLKPGKAANGKMTILITPAPDKPANGKPVEPGE